MKALVTGGAGFIGSHLVEELLRRGEEVHILDNLSSGRIEFIKGALSKGAVFHKMDLLDRESLRNLFSSQEFDVVFHLAANPDVRIGAENTWIHLEQNVLATYNLLEEMRRSDVKELVFTSSSTVYGEAEEIPTPEDYGPLKPISMYGASKLACEGMITAYSHLYGIRGVIYRFANVVGPRSTHGVIYDFIMKLKRDPRKLEILGDGKQKKSYLYIDDCISGIMFGYEHRRSDVEIFNLGSEDWIEVRRIAEIVVEEMGLSGVKFEFTGGIGGRGWKGDVKFMRLSIEKIKSYGWRPKYNSEEAVRLTARSLVKEVVKHDRPV